MKDERVYFEECYTIPGEVEWDGYEYQPIREESLDLARRINEMYGVYKMALRQHETEISLLRSTLKLIVKSTSDRRIIRLALRALGGKY